LVTQQDIEAAVGRMVSVAHAPLKVILFGSRAVGGARPDSDVDLLVVEEEIPDFTAEYARLRQAVGYIGTGVDILLYPRKEFERRSSWTSSAVFAAVNGGRVLFEAPKS
jgi:uncharacterized protein